MEMLTVLLAPSDGKKEMEFQPNDDFIVLDIIHENSQMCSWFRF